MKGTPAPDEDPPNAKDDVLVLIVSIIGATAMLAAYSLADKLGR